jgi:O-antigen/teichoic acid export membrane protein
MGQFQKLFGQTAIYGLGTIVPRLLNYVLLTPFYTRIFSSSQYGIVTELYAYVVFLLVILTYGMETGFFRFANAHSSPKKVFSTIIFSLFSTSVLFIVLVTLLQDQIATILDYPDQKYLILLFTLVVTIDAFSAIPFAKLRFEEKAKKFGYLKIFNVLVNLFFNFIFFIFFPYILKNFPDSFLLHFYNSEIGVGYVFISNLIASIATLLLLLPEIKIRLDFINIKLLKQIYAYSLPLLIVGLAGTVNEVADKIMLKIFIDDRESALRQLGIYGANYKLGMLMTIFIQMFRYAAEPFYFSKMKDRDAKEVYAAVMKYFILFGLLIFLVVMLYIDIFKHFIGGEFHSGLKVVPIILTANLFLGIVYNLSIWYKLSNRTNYGAFITGFGALITIIMNIILIPEYGYIGCAWATLTCYVSMFFISYFVGRKFYFIPYPVKSILFYLVLAYGIFFLQDFIQYPNLALKIVFNSLFLLFFLAIILKKEKIAIADIKEFLKF